MLIVLFYRPFQISIHALREEGDLLGHAGRFVQGAFLSTPSARRATAQLLEDFRAGKISIHALREEGDSIAPEAQRVITKFLSTPSARRATSVARMMSPAVIRFLSTPSARRATGHKPAVHELHPISIHALREEGDSVPY